MVFVLMPVSEERYDSSPAPVLIKVWLDKAPMVFLIIAAVLFVIGLNLFVYIPSQSQVRTAHRGEALVIPTISHRSNTYRCQQTYLPSCTACACWL